MPSRQGKSQVSFSWSISPVAVVLEGDASSEGVVCSDPSATNPWLCPGFANLFHSCMPSPGFASPPGQGPELSGQVAVVGIKLVKDIRASSDKGGGFCGQTNLAKAAFVTGSDQEACCRYQRIEGLEASA